MRKVAYAWTTGPREACISSPLVSSGGHETSSGHTKFPSLQHLYLVAEQKRGCATTAGMELVALKSRSRRFETDQCWFMWDDSHSMTT